MNSKRKVNVSKERGVRTYVEMRRTSDWLLRKAQEEAAGSVFQLRASLLFTAFTLEAYLNHIGEKIFLCWADLERLSPRQKLNVIAERLDVKVDYGRRPWQIVKELFAFRNAVAHGKTENLTESEKNIPLERYSDDDFHELVPTEWEKYSTQQNAVRAREDVEKILKTMHAAAGFEDDFLFHSGFQFGSATVVEE